MSDFITGIKNICVLGGGAWGTALSCTLSSGMWKTSLIVRSKNSCQEMNSSRENKRYLPGIKLPDDLEVFDRSDCVEKADVLLVVVPSQENRRVLTEISEKVRPGVPIILCSKGIEFGTCQMMSDIAKSCIPASPSFVLTGPGFASDVASYKPIALTLAGEKEYETVHKGLQSLFDSSRVRIYLSNDVISCQLGGALKNVYAIACGVVSGYGLGASSQASLMTRCFAEMSRICLSMGGSLETISGLAGLGDLVLSTHSNQSRNFSLGYSIAKGTMQSTNFKGVCEGEKTASVAVDLSKKFGVDAPVALMTRDLLYGNIEIKTAINHLMDRPLKYEFQLYE